MADSEESHGGGERSNDRDEHDGGPSRWLIPFLDARHDRIAPKDHEEARAGGGVPSTYWRDRITEYRARQADARARIGEDVRRRVAVAVDIARVAGIPGTTNWIPLGPSVLRRGPTSGRAAVSGRAGGIAVAPGGTRVYVATADGGVWRSDDTGRTWAFTMEQFDLNPASFAATSLACGAIAIDPADPDRVYVGTGEGDTSWAFANRLRTALPSYRGIGPIRSDDGGAHWQTEPTAVDTPTLVGSAFYALAVDPGDRDHVVAATNVGLYRREPDGSGGYHWIPKRAGIHSSVVAARAGGVTTFYAAAWGDRVYGSTDGSVWTVAGTGFPPSTLRIGLAVRPTDPAVLYALVARPNGTLLGVYRLDGGAGAWRLVSGAPPDLFGPQGDFDLAIAVDPNDADTIYLGGQARPDPDPTQRDANLYRGRVTATGSGTSLAYAMARTFIGTNVHVDVHALVHAPGDSSTLWVACDGGIFRTTDATGASVFESRNVGLATLSVNYLAQHPTEPAVIFCGVADNGVARYTGEECWAHVRRGDGGQCVINWNDPFKVLVFTSYNGGGRVFRATDGGQDYASWMEVTPAGVSWTLLAEPLVTTPYNPASPTDADVVAFGVGGTAYISTDFGNSWPPAPSIGSTLVIYTMAFASPTRLYAATTEGRVYRYDAAGGVWTPTRIDNAAGGALPVSGLITDVVIDLADPTGASIYVVFSNNGTYQHLWHFDGTAWQPRSGPGAGAATSLLDIGHNAIVVDPDHPSTLYVGADIGVWKSTDGGANWSVMETGLPDAAVLDLVIHRPSRRLRAALHGRGVFAYQLDPPAPREVELYIRDTTLDLGLTSTVDGVDDPARWPRTPVRHWDSPNIKVDAPTPNGYQTPSDRIDFYEFNDRITDASGAVATLDPALGTVTNRVYVEVHNRGIQLAASVRVMLLLTNASAGLGPLPAGYTANVQAGTPISTPAWQTVGVRALTNLAVGLPQVAAFHLQSTMLPPPASLPGQSHYCLVAIAHATDDPFTRVETSVDLLTVADRKVAQKNLHVVEFVGTPPADAVSAIWASIRVNGRDDRTVGGELVFDLARFPGRVGVVLPKRLVTRTTLEGHRTAKPELVGEWAAGHRARLEAFMRENRFARAQCERMIRDVADVVDQPLVVLDASQREAVIGGMTLERGASHTAFLAIRRPPDAKVGDRFEFSVALREAGAGRVLGGSTYRVVVVAAAGG